MTSTQTKTDPFGARDTFQTTSGPVGIYRLTALEQAGITQIDDLPFSIRVLLESVLAAYERVRAYETIITWADVATLHALRIEGKRLRYTLECFSEVLPAPSVAVARRARATPARRTWVLPKISRSARMRR